MELTRRKVLQDGFTCAACLLAAPHLNAAIMPAFFETPANAKEVVTTPWAKVHQLGDGIWAAMSTPFDGDARTFCNGGLIAGKDAVLAIEGFADPSGAAWLSDLSVKLTGKRPQHVVLTHCHGDHSSGLAGYVHGEEPLEIVSTSTTRKLMLEREIDRQPRRFMLPDKVVDFSGGALKIDLGGRTATVTEYRGHTPSDLIVQIDGVTFGGDLFWKAIFPNFVDAIPSQHLDSVRKIKEQGGFVVPGHGGFGEAKSFDVLVKVLEDVEQAARAAIKAGTPMKQAAAGYKIPAPLGEWKLLSPSYYEVAFNAWQRELSPS
jgi:glyoxylase-like metal-dependent hydrolase (beta-lactamase superfamily II)